MIRYSPAELGTYWPRRFGFFLHISGGMVAVLTGPWQFSQRLRQRNLQLHRYMGRAYLLAVLAGATGAAYLAVTTKAGHAWSFGLLGLDAAWLTTSGMALYMIKQGQVQLHREWMVRSYIATFGFVSFRLMTDYLPTAWLGSEMDAAITWIWGCWAVPLLVYEVLLSLRRLPAQRRAGS